MPKPKPDEPLTDERIRELQGCIEAGCREFGPLDVADIHRALAEVLGARQEAYRSRLTTLRQGG
jgi:hypothetical protein